MDPRGEAVKQIKREYQEWERQFIPEPIPKGTPNRTALRKAANTKAKELAELPHNQEIRAEFSRRLENARNIASGQYLTIQTRRKIVECRANVVQQLIEMGFCIEKQRGGSFYLKYGTFVVRVSDHEVPMTPERRNGKSWAKSHWQLVITVGTHFRAIKRWIERVEHQIKEVKCQ